MPRSTVSINDVKPGMVLWAQPGALMEADALTSQTLGKARKDKHPLLVLSHNVTEEEVTVTYIASFSSSPDLKHLGLDESVKKVFIPVDPATKEYDHAVIKWESNPNPTACWIWGKTKMKLTGKEVRGGASSSC